MKPMHRIAAVGMLFGALLSAPCRADGETVPSPDAAAAARTLAETWGIECVAVRVSGAGRLIDFRYKILDGDKAVALTKRENVPYLIDVASNAKLMVPNVPKIGALRQTSVRPPVGTVFGILFANPAEFVKSGSRVTVVVGDCRIENLIVQ